MCEGGKDGVRGGRGEGKRWQGRGCMRQRGLVPVLVMASTAEVTGRKERGRYDNLYMVYAGRWAGVLACT